MSASTAIGMVSSSLWNLLNGEMILDPDVPVTILAPDVTTTVDVARMRSKSKNMPFGGWELRGTVAATIVAGRTIYINDAVSGAEAFTTGC